MKTVNPGIINKPTPGGRWMSVLDQSHLTKTPRNKKLTKITAKSSGRNHTGLVTTRHQGGRQKRFLRIIDWKRSKQGVAGSVLSIQYDPNRTANIALVQYPDGEQRYIIAPDTLRDGDEVMSGEMAPFSVGNALPMGKIPVGTTVHCVELRPGRGAQIGRSAGTGLIIQGRDQDSILLKLPSGEVRRINPLCFATIGQVSNPAWKNVTIGKAGRNRRLGKKPGVRGTAQHPGSHPHGGGEGRSGVGMAFPKTPWGKHALGKKTRNPRKYSNRSIVQSRHVKVR